MSHELPENTHLEDAYCDLRKRLHSFGLTFGLSDNDSNDILHDGYIRLKDEEMESFSQAQGKLWVTMKNLAIDLLRLRSRRREDGSINEGDRLSDRSRPDFVIKDEIDSLSNQMKALLSPVQLEIFRLMAFEDCEYSEIAQKLGMTEVAVRVNVSRARKILKEKLKL